MKSISLVIALLSLASAPLSLYAEPTAKQNALRIHTGVPKKTNDALFSYTAEWGAKDGKIYRATGLSFLNADKLDALQPELQVSKKLLTAMKDGMTQLHPTWRGISVDHPEGKPEVTVSDKPGYILTTVTVKDYSNQTLSFDLGGRQFASEGVKLAIDLVLAADVDYLDNFSAQKAQTASQGEITVAIDGQKPIAIKTDGKTTRELEQEIVQQLQGAQLSNAPLFTLPIHTDKRNNKPFDGSEVQLAKLAGQTLTITVNDPELGVINKFQFQNGKSDTAAGSESRFALIALGLASILALGYAWRRNAKKSST